MGAYRKKPVVIEAIPCNRALQSAEKDWASLPDWMVSAYDAGQVIFGDGQIHIKTLEGTMVGEREDWIIQGIAGELYPCKPEIFEQTYEAVA